MRTYFNATVTNRNVFGFGQDRVVVLSSDTCAAAAQHLASRHASKCAKESARALKRSGSGTTGITGAVLRPRHLCLHAMGPQWQPVRRTSPALVIA